MIINDKLTEREELLLRDHNIVVDDNDYSFAELDSILEVVGNAKMNSFVMRSDSRRALHEEYVVLYDKIFQFCEDQYTIENPDEFNVNQKNKNDGE